mmetsp:Transcript_21242/g.46302  ORF Transcript_21242/g.46302 Transcript_21242/m.46302 type:complete len:402 (-) Transcript_21242:146-1351(-)
MSRLNLQPAGALRKLSGGISGRGTNIITSGGNGTGNGGGGGSSRSLSSLNSNSNEPANTRRHANRWSATVSSSQLYPVSHAVPHNLRSCMKVHTLEDSLASVGRKRYGGGSRLKHLLRRTVVNGGGSRRGGGDGGGLRASSARNVLRNSHHPASSAAPTNGGDDDGGGGGGGADSTRAATARTANTAAPTTAATATNATTNNINNNTNKKKTVTFTTIQFREYEVQPGVNPGATQHGAVIELGWNFIQTPHQSLANYEHSRPPRKRMVELVLLGWEREQRLLESGCSPKEIRASTKSVRMAQKKRQRTLKKMKYWRKHVRREEQRVHVRTMLRMEKRYSQQEDELWSRANDSTLKEQTSSGNKVRSTASSAARGSFTRAARNSFTRVASARNSFTAKARAA